MSDLSSAISALDNAVDVVLVVDNKENILSVNPAAQRLWGFTAKELTGTWFGSLIAPEDGPVALRALKQVAHNKPCAPFECRVLRKDGSTITMLWSLNFREQDNQVLCLAHDISERKAAELRLRLSEARSRLIIEGLPISLFITDSNGIVELANPSAEAMFGVPLSSMLGQPLQNILFAATKTQTDAGFIAKIAAARAIEIQAERPDGVQFPLEITVNEFAGINGMNYIITLQDVSDRHQIEKLKRELVSLISHDIGGPLTSVQGVLALLEEGIFAELEEDGAEAVRLANLEISRVIKLIDGLVGVTKSTFGSTQLKPEPVLLSDLLLTAIEKVMWNADAKEIVFATPEFNPTLQVDIARLTNVLITFLTRAIDGSVDGGTVEISAEESYKRHATIRVRPLEVSKAHIPSAVKKSVDENIEERRNVLGLAICRSVIERHGGTLDLSDETHADFIITLPSAR